MKRVLSLVLALVLVLGMIPTFAAEMTGAEHLKTHEFITGDENGDLMVDNMLTRQQLAAIIAELNGVKEEASEFALPPAYADVAKIGGWAKPFVAYAQVNEWMTGKPGNMFDPLNGVPAQQLAAVILNVLGYEFTWDTALTVAEDLGIMIDANGVLTRGEAFEALWVAVSEVPMNTEAGLTLGVHLGKLEPATPVVEDMAVKAVTSDNLKQVVVEFTQAIDEDTLDIAGSDATVKYYLNGSTTASYFTDYSLSDDGMTLVFVAATFTQSDELKVVVDGVKNVAKDAIEDYETTLVAKDVTNPEVVSLTLDNSKQITVTFSEPINLTTTAFAQRTNELKIDDVTIVASAAVDYANNQVVYTLGSKLAVGEHKIWLGKLNDFANFKTAEYTQNVTLVADKTAPVVTAVEVVSPAKIKVTFNESVSTLGTVTVEENATLTTSAPVWNAGKTAVTLTLSGNLGLVSLIEATLVYDGTTDAEGNASDEAEFVFKATDDTAKPTATVEISATNKLTVTFSESMATSGVFTIKDADGTTVATLTNPAFKTGTSDTVVEIAAATIGFDEVDAENYTVEVKNSTDGSVRANTITKFTATVATVDTKNPTVTGVVLTAADKVTVYFSEVMDNATVTNEENFLVDLNGGDNSYVSLSTITDASISYSNDKIVITLPGAVAATTQVKALLLKDVAGNTIATADFNAVKLVSAPNTFDVADLSAIELVAKNQIKLTSTVKWGTVDPAGFVVKKTGGADVLVGTSTSLSADGLKLTVTLNGNVNSDVTLDAVVAQVKVTGTSVKDYQGNALTLGDTAIADKVAPTFVSAKAAANTNVITLTFDEAVYADVTAVEYDLKVMVQASTPYQLAVGEFTTANNAGVITLTVTKAGIDASKITVELLNGRYIGDNKDANATFNGTENLASAFAATTVTNTAASADFTFDTTAPLASVPAATAATTNDADSLVITFNEALYFGGVAVANAADVSARFTAAGGTLAITSAVYDSTAKTVTFVLANAANTNTVTIDASELTDAFGNSVSTTTDVATYTAVGTIWAIN